MNTHALPHRTKEKRLFVKLQRPETLADSGRYLFNILNAFSLASYQILLSSSVTKQLKHIYGSNIRNFPPPARLALELESVKIVEAPPAASDKDMYVFDREDKTLRKQDWYKRVQIEYDLFSRYLFSKPIIMPYSVHPIHGANNFFQRAKALRSTPRNMTVLFAGDLKGYKRNWIHYPETKLSRVQVMEAIRSCGDVDIIFLNNPTDAQAISSNEFTGKCVIADNETKIEWTQWLPTIAKASFFLCPPGIVMPMCHNIIEAMSVGTIPITNYPEWLSPDLKHLENCIVFRDETDLIRKIKLALQMDQDEIMAMKDNVVRYFETFLSPLTFVRRLERRNEEKIIVLMHSERYVAKHCSKLNSVSILINGEENAGKLHWTKRILPRILC